MAKFDTGFEGIRIRHFYSSGKAERKTAMLLESDNHDQWCRVGARCQVAAYVLANASGDDVRLLYLHEQHSDSEIAELCRAGFSRRVGIVGLRNTALEAVCGPGSRTIMQHAMQGFLVQVLFSRLDFLREAEELELNRVFALPDTRAN
jgi:hypothetical protein